MYLIDFFVESSIETLPFRARSSITETGLVAMEVNGRKVILPVWHNVTRNDVAKYSPILAGRLAVSSSTGLDNVVAEIVRAIA